MTGAASYNIQYRIVGTTTWLTATSSSASVIISSLTPASTYEFQVQAVCSGSTTGSWSALKNFVTLGSCGVPGGLTTGVLTPTTAVVSWTAVTGAVSYNLSYTQASSVSWTTVSTSSTSYTLTGLTAGVLYDYKVQTVCSSGTSGFSLANTFTTPPAAHHTDEIFDIYNSGTDENIPVNIYPNPTSDKITVAYTLNATQQISISVTDYMGRIVSQIQENAFQEAGDHEYSYMLPGKGLYFVKMTVDNRISVFKVVKL